MRKRVYLHPDEVKKNITVVFTMVENGCKIREALKKLNIESATFYKLLSTEQKILLGMTKAKNAKYHANPFLSFDNELD
jgi:hypothetical protein